MDRIVRIALIGVGFGLCLGRVAEPAVAPPPDAPVAAAEVVPGVWQHRGGTINYFGITALYSCDALEDHVRNILIHLGARSDAKIRANGCPRGQEVPSRTALIETDFYVLAPADATTTSLADTVKAYWAPRAVTSNKPYFMGAGDCELIEQMKDLISKNLSLRDLQYRTDCVPHQIAVDGFSISGQALIPITPPGGVKKT